MEVISSHELGGTMRRAEGMPASRLRLARQGDGSGSSGGGGSSGSGGGGGGGGAYSEHTWSGWATVSDLRARALRLRDAPMIEIHVSDLLGSAADAQVRAGIS